MILRNCSKLTLAGLIVLCLGAFLEVAAEEESAADDPRPEVRLDFTYGHLGPPRVPEFIAGERMATRIQIRGLSTSRDDGGARFSIRIIVKNETDEVIESVPSTEFYTALPLGGNTFTQALIMPVPLESPAGKYSAKIIVTDQLNNKTIHRDTSFILLPRNSFGAKLIYLSKDQEGNAPLSSVLPAGEVVFLQSTITGMEAKDGKANVTTSIHVVDGKQKPIGNRPVESKNHRPFHSSDSSVGVRTAYPIHLNRPGKFTLRFKARDEHSGKEVKHELSIVVIDTLREFSSLD